MEMFPLAFLRVFAAAALLSAASGTETGLEKHIFPPLPVGVTKSENSACREQSEVYSDSLRNLTLWAYEMWDATAKSSSGVLRGNVFQMGHYDQCLTAEAPFETQYCLVAMKANVPRPGRIKDPIALHHDPLKPVWERLYPYEDKSQQTRNQVQMGWCVPASCTPQDLETFLNEYIEDLDLPLKANNVTYTAKLSNLVCHTKSEHGNFDAADITFCILSLVLVLLVLVISLLDMRTESKDPDEKKPQRSSLPCRLLISFSAKRNLADLLRADESNPALTILYGMRTLAILMIILDHRFGTFTSSALMNFNYVEGEYRSPYAFLIFHGDLFVDSFFILSGLLVAYGLLNQFDKKIINPGFIILMRYVRLTPAYAFVIFYYATIFDLTGSGPLWKIIAGQDSQDCKDNWWANLLYISNYVNADHMCMTHSWYLPCDFHYFIVGIVVCILIKKEKKFGLGALLFLTILSIIVPFVITLVYLRPALLYFYPEFLTGPKTHPDFLLTYSKSHTRATPYFIGMFAGYVYHRAKGTDKHISRIKSYAILLVSIFLVVLALVSGAVFYNPYHEYNAVESAAYAALHRVAFGFGSIGVLYVASFGHARLLYNILAWRPWIPLSKLVYGAYLIHMQFQLRSAAKFMNPRFFSYFDVIHLGISDMVLAFFSALALYLVIEAPCRRIFRELLMPSRDPPKKEIREATRENLRKTNNNTCSSADSRL